MNNGFISHDAKLVDTVLGENIKIYKEAEIQHSRLEDSTSVGDQSIILHSRIESNSAINRRNYILRSKIGNYTYTGIGTMILSAIIGKFCSISWNVSIGGENHDYNKVTTHPLWRFHAMDTGCLNYSINYDNQEECVIGNDVWIASNAIILRGLKVGDGAVIGAGAVVTKDVDPYSIVAGVPAKMIGMRFDEDTISMLQKIQWWNWPKEVIRQNVDLIYCSDVNDEVISKLYEISKSLELI